MQPALGINTRYFEAALSLRFSYYQPHSFHYIQSVQGNRSMDFYNKQDYLFLEPALTLRGGLPEAKLQFQLQLSHLASSNNLDYDPEVVSLMLHLNMDRIFQRLSK